MTVKSSSNVLIGLVGDVLVNRPNPLDAFSRVRDILSAPQILFGNLEGAYADNEEPVSGVVGTATSPASNLDVFAKVGFNVLSLANNHTLDGGYPTVLENLSRLRSQGVHTCGAGRTLSEARRPAIIEANGTVVAFLAYSSVFPIGHEAGPNRPGIAPMRAHNHWREALPTIHTPGMYPIVTTVPDEADLAHLTEDIKQAKESADVVVMSFHWGDQTCPFHLTDHEKRTAKYCIDKGADMVVGHHHHAIRGMEWYNGKPIMYGLGHFVFDYPLGGDAEVEAKLLEWDPTGHFARVPYAPGAREGWPLLPLHEDTRMTIFAWAAIDLSGGWNIGFLPCALAPDGVVHPLTIGSPDCRRVLDYFEKCNMSQRLNGRIVQEEPYSTASLPGLRVIPL